MNLSSALRRRSVRIAMTALVIVALPFALLFGRWSYYAFRCGHQPIETSDFAAADSYTVPGDGTYTVFPIMNGFACELSEVEGRHHSTLR
jgi:hypothetical protein